MVTRWRFLCVAIIYVDNSYEMFIAIGISLFWEIVAIRINGISQCWQLSCLLFASTHNQQWDNHDTWDDETEWGI